jgi:hypothetical protein
MALWRSRVRIPSAPPLFYKEERINMKMIRDHAVLKKMSKKDDCYMNASPRERISFMWELTSEVWALKGTEDVKRRLQRNITNIIK